MREVGRHGFGNVACFRQSSDHRVDGYTSVQYPPRTQDPNSVTAVVCICFYSLQLQTNQCATRTHDANASVAARVSALMLGRETSGARWKSFVEPPAEHAKYPQWLRKISRMTRDTVSPRIFQQCAGGGGDARFCQFWPVIDSSRSMAMNLLKVQYSLGTGHAMARKYLIRNIRVEQNHVEYWID